MSDFIAASIHSVFHVLGYGVPSFVKAICTTPLAVADRLAAPEKCPRQGAWIITASARNSCEARRESSAAADNDNDEIFDALSFFGFDTNSDPLKKRHGFTNQRYPYPLYDGHFHTIVGGTRKPISSKKMGYQREVIKAKYDGNTLFLEWKMCDPAKFPHGPKGVIAIIPGLCSGPNTSYVQRFVNHATRNGFHVVVLATRGMGSAPLEYGNMTAGTFIYDIQFILEEYLSADYMANRFGDRNMKVIAVGFSLGAAMLVNHLGTCPNSRLYCAVAAEAPWDFHASTRMMGTRFARMFYQPALMKGLWNVLRKTGDNIIEFTKSERLRDNMKMLMGKMKHKGGMKGYTVNDFDELVVAPAQGFECASDYYTAASPFQRLPNVTVPLMCFSAMDDPITGPPPTVEEWNDVCSANHNILHVRSPCGGHLGFMRGPIDEMKKRTGYMDELIVKSISAALGNEALCKVNDSNKKTADREEGNGHSEL